MKVTARRTRAGFQYRLAREPSDRGEASHILRGVPFQLVGDRWEVRLPPVFEGIHPDLHALAVYQVLRPMVGRRLKLSFGVSSDCAAAFARSFGVELPRVDAALRPRREPDNDVPGLLYSGGLDSSAASLLLPARTAVCHASRIDRAHEAGTMVPDMPFATQSARRDYQCRKVRRLGRRLYRVYDDHEYLYRPYPIWHANDRMAWSAMFYLADSLRLRYVETGHVLEDMCHTGFRFDRMRTWRLADTPFKAVSPDSKPAARDRDISLEVSRLRFFGLRMARSMAGLSTVATARIVARSPYRGDASPCDKPYADPFIWERERSLGFSLEPSANYCMECPRCFHKRMLVDVALGRETSAEVVDHYLRIPFVAQELRKRFLDWHHIWVYVLQRVRCRHPLIRELQKQAQRQLDLAFLEKWHPNGRDAIPAPYRETVEKGIRSRVKVMTPQEVAVLRQGALGPLRVPADLGLRPQDAAPSARGR